MEPTILIATFGIGLASGFLAGYGLGLLIGARNAARQFMVEYDRLRSEVLNRIEEISKRIP